MNFAQKILDHGFKPLQKDFNPLHGWNGVSTFHPYYRLIKGDKSVEFEIRTGGRGSHLAIRLFKGQELCYSTVDGIPPSDMELFEFMNY